MLRLQPGLLHALVARLVLLARLLGGERLTLLCDLLRAGLLLAGGRLALLRQPLGLGLLLLLRGALIGRAVGQLSLLRLLLATDIRQLLKFGALLVLTVKPWRRRAEVRLLPAVKARFRVRA